MGQFRLYTLALTTIITGTTTRDRCLAGIELTPAKLNERDDLQHLNLILISYSNSTQDTKSVLKHVRFIRTALELAEFEEFFN